MSRDLGSTAMNFELAPDPLENEDDSYLGIKRRHSERHNLRGKNLSSAVQGGLNGMMTIFSILTTVMVIGGNFGLIAIVALGVANKIADGFATVIRDCLTNIGQKNETNEANEISIKGTEENAQKIVKIVAFALFGLIPLTPFLVAAVLTYEAKDTLFCISLCLTALSLVILGVGKTFYSGISWYRAVGETLIIGVGRGTSSYLIGLAFRGVG